MVKANEGSSHFLSASENGSDSVEGYTLLHKIGNGAHATCVLVRGDATGALYVMKVINMTARIALMIRDPSITLAGVLPAD